MTSTAGGFGYDQAVLNQDRAKQERLLNLAGWLYHKHRFLTPVPGGGFSEFRFTRDDLADIPALEYYSPDKGDASERAILRDATDLRGFGIDLRWVGSERAWASRVTPLNDAECRALAIAALQVLVDDGADTKDGYHVPGSALSADGAELIVSYAPITDFLIEAIKMRSTVRIAHRGRERVVDPWHVILSEGRWYLIGRDHDADQRRAFAVDAIKDWGVDDRSAGYTLPRDDFGALASEILDPDNWVEAEPVEVTLEVHPRLVRRAQSLLGASVDRTTGRGEWVPMTCVVRNVDVFLGRLWGLRARAVVIGPSEIRDRVVVALREMV